MRVPPLVSRYSLSICSADFNEWIWKNTSVRSPYSYVGTGEYEIFEFDLGNTFNYAEMASLIAPRPFIMINGENDSLVPHANVLVLYAAAGRPKELTWVAGEHAQPSETKLLDTLGGIVSARLVEHGVLLPR